MNDTASGIWCKMLSSAAMIAVLASGCSDGGESASWKSKERPPGKPSERASASHPPYNRDLMERVCARAKRARVVAGAEFVDSSRFAPDFPDTAYATAYCDYALFYLKDKVKAHVAIEVDVSSVKLGEREPLEEWLERHRGIETAGIRERPKTLPGYESPVFAARQDDLPDSLKTHTYVFSGNYMVRIAVYITAVRKGESKAVRRSDAIANELVTVALDVLPRPR